MRLLGTLMWVLLAMPLCSQRLISLEEAVSEALKSNHRVLIAKELANAAKANNTAGQAGMLPQVNATLSDNFSLNSLSQQFSSGLEVQRKGVSGNNLSAQVSLQWTVFDGLAMFVNKQRLNRLEELGSVSLLQEMEEVAVLVINGYSNLVRIKQHLKANEATVALAEERSKMAELKLREGISPKTEMLQAQIDRNAARSAQKILQKEELKFKADLNSLMGKQPDEVFDVTDSIPFDPSVSTTSDFPEARGAELRQAEIRIAIAGKEVRLAKSDFFPVLSVSTGYQYNRTSNSAGFALFNRTNGLLAGFNLQIPLFGGLNRFTRLQVAKIQERSAAYSLDQMKIQWKSRRYRAWADYREAFEQLGLEQENITLAAENLRINRDRFRLRQGTAIELRAAEESMEQSRKRLSDARHQLKTAETELLRLEGRLLQK
jgi:outer membrane protein